MYVAGIANIPVEQTHFLNGAKYHPVTVDQFSGAPPSEVCLKDLHSTEFENICNKKRSPKTL